MHRGIAPMVINKKTLSLILDHVKIYAEQLHPGVVTRSISTFSLTDPRILINMWSPLVGLIVQRISREPVDGVVHVVPVFKGCGACLNAFIFLGEPQRNAPNIVGKIDIKIRSRSYNAGSG